MTLQAAPSSTAEQVKFCSWFFPFQYEALHGARWLNKIFISILSKKLSPMHPFSRHANLGRFHPLVFNWARFLSYSVYWNTTYFGQHIRSCNPSGNVCVSPKGVENFFFFPCNILDQVESGIAYRIHACLIKESSLLNWKVHEF